MLIVLGRVYMPKKDLVIYSAKQNEGSNLSFFLPECIHEGLLSESPTGKEYFCALLWVGAPPAGHQATYRFSSGHQLVTLLFISILLLSSERQQVVISHSSGSVDLLKSGKH